MIKMRFINLNDHVALHDDEDDIHSHSSLNL